MRTTSSGCSSPNRHSRLAPVELAGSAGVAHVVVAAPARVQLAEDLRQRGRAEPAHGLGGELEPPALAGEVTLPLQLAFELLQRAQVVDRLPAEGVGDGLRVDVVERRAGVVLA